MGRRTCNSTDLRLGSTDRPRVGRRDRERSGLRLRGISSSWVGRDAREGCGLGLGRISRGSGNLVEYGAHLGLGGSDGLEQSVQVGNGTDLRLGRIDSTRVNCYRTNATGLGLGGVTSTWGDDPAAGNTDADSTNLRLGGGACSSEGFSLTNSSGLCLGLSLIHISEPTRLLSISYAVF